MKLKNVLKKTKLRQMTAHICTIGVAGAFMLLSACSNSAKQEDAAASTPVDSVATAATESTGGDKDAHGCIPSAGYQWVEVKQSCMRVSTSSEVPMTPIKVESWQSSVSIFFNNDRTKAEAFFTDANGAAHDEIMDLQPPKKGIVGAPSVWKNTDCMLTETNGTPPNKYALSFKGKVVSTSIPSN